MSRIRDVLLRKTQLKKSKKVALRGCKKNFSDTTDIHISQESHPSTLNNPTNK